MSSINACPICGAKTNIYRTKPTNADRIRAMSDEQLSELHRWSDCDDCIAREYCRGEMYMEKECKEIVLEWLKQGVE